MATAKDHLARIQRRPALNGLDSTDQAFAIFDRGPLGDGETGYGLLLVKITNQRDAADTVRIQQSSDNGDSDAYTDLTAAMRSDLSTTGATVAMVALGVAEVILPVSTERYIKFDVDGVDEADVEIRVIHHLGTLDLINRTA